MGAIIQPCPNIDDGLANLKMSVNRPYESAVLRYGFEMLETKMLSQEKFYC